MDSGSLVAAALPLSSSAYDYSRSEHGGRVEYESYGSGSGAQGRQKATRDAYELYMQGYRDPIQGDIAIELNKRTGGRDSDVWALVIIGADDRRRGLPIRFELVE